MEPPDRLEKGIRFGCGFFFGVLAAITAPAVWLWHAHSVVALGLLVGLLCGWLALRYGDTFWEKVFRWWGIWW